MSLATFLAVGLGGALGALCRHMATTYFKPRLKGSFPLHTLGINAVACCIAGCVLTVEAHMGNVEHMAISMGFLGGFSTLSTMNFEAVNLLTGGHVAQGIAYLVATYGCALGFAALGFFAAGALL